MVTTTKWANLNDPHDVNMGRPGPYGNNWSHKKKSLAKYKTDSVQDSLDCYRNWFYAPEQEEFRKEIILKLTGKILGCWCRSENRCHVGIIIDYINKEYIKTCGFFNRFLCKSKI